jgi:hypothetical protein
MGAWVRYCQVRYMYECGSFWEPHLAADAGAMWKRERENPVAAPALA